MKRRWDAFTYKISGHFLSALINDDYSGLDDEEDSQLAAWQSSAEENARAQGWSVGHWTADTDSTDDFGRCDVTGMLAMRVEVTLHVYKE